MPGSPASHCLLWSQEAWRCVCVSVPEWDTVCNLTPRNMSESKRMNFNPGLGHCEFVLLWNAYHGSGLFSAYVSLTRSVCIFWVKQNRECVHMNVCVFVSSWAEVKGHSWGTTTAFKTQRCSRKCLIQPAVLAPLRPAGDREWMEGKLSEDKYLENTVKNLFIQFFLSRLIQTNTPFFISYPQNKGHPLWLHTLIGHSSSMLSTIIPSLNFFKYVIFLTFYFL